MSLICENAVFKKPDFSLYCKKIKDFFFGKPGKCVGRDSKECPLNQKEVLNGKQ